VRKEFQGRRQRVRGRHPDLRHRRAGPEGAIEG
jgi:hypothetical protein